MQPLLQIKQGRFGYLLAVTLCLVLFLVSIYAILLGFHFWSDPADRPESVDFIPVIMGGILIIPCSLLLYYFIKRMIANPPVFTIYAEGFETDTNGISSGLIPWKSIQAMEEVLVSMGEAGSTRKESALAIHLTEMSILTDQLPRWVRFFYKVAGQTGRYRSTNSPKDQPEAVPILIPIGALGNQYEEAIKLIQQYSGIKLKHSTEQP
jgi:hypothetical protein